MSDVPKSAPAPVFLIALAATNTAAVRVHWVFGGSHVALVWLALAAAILGWLLDLAATPARLKSAALRQRLARAVKRTNAQVAGAEARRTARRPG